MCDIRIITESRIKEWCESHSMIEAALLHWLGLMKQSTAQSFTELHETFNTVDLVEVASERNVCVFNMGYKKSAHRLIAAIHSDRQKVFVLRLLTHAEYDKDNWKNDL